MKKIQYEELMQMALEEKFISLSDVSTVVSSILKNADLEREEFEDFDYEDSPRKKLRNIANLFENEELQILGNSDTYHNVAVDFARQDMYDCACRILKRGLAHTPYSIDLLSDLIRYGISSGQYDLCEEPYKDLNRISKDMWTWRAFSFSIDYLAELSNHANSMKKRNNLKQMSLDLANQFIERIKSDQAYYDKAFVLCTFGSNEKDGIVETEESVLKSGLEEVKVAPKCALRLANILFNRGEYLDAINVLQRCCINAFKPQPDINGGYAFLLLALSKASKLYNESQKIDYADNKSLIDEMYKDFHTAISFGLVDVFDRSARTAIKVLEAQTNIEYPYTDAIADDLYDF